MQRLAILGLGLVSAMVIIDCGARTPLADEDLFGPAGAPGLPGSSGSTGVGGSVVLTGGAGSGNSFGGSVNSAGANFGGSPGFGGNTAMGTGGAIVTTGGGGATGFGGRGGGGFGGSFGMGGFIGTAGFAGTGGFVGAGGAAGNPAQVAQLIDQLPGVRSTPACVGCATICPGSAQCAATPACVSGLTCVTDNCRMRNGNPDPGCIGRCVGGNPQALAQVIAAVGCVYATCAQPCTGRMR